MMDKNSLLYPLLALFLLLGILSGCSGQTRSGAGNNHDHYTTISSEKPIDQSPSNQIERELVKKKNIYKVRAVNTSDELLVAITVPHFDRFKLKKIESNLKEELKNKYPAYKVEVSSDYKAFLEISQLEAKIHKNKLNRVELKKNVKRINNLIKEQT